MKKLEDYMHGTFISLDGIDESIAEKIKNLDGYKITECCGYGNCDGDACTDCTCDTSCEIGAPVEPADYKMPTPIVQSPEEKYRSIFASYPHVMDLYNVHTEFIYKCRFQVEYERAHKEPIIFYDYATNLECGKYFMCQGLHDDVLKICADEKLEYPVLFFRNNGEIQLFAIKHMGTNGKECSIKNSLIEAVDILNNLEKRKEISWAQVLDVSIDNLDDLYTFLFTCTFEKDKYDKEIQKREEADEFPHPINKHVM